MAKRVGVDKWLFGVTLLMVLFGLVMVFSASAVMAKERYGSPYTFVLRQAAWAVLGLIVLAILMRVDYRKWNHPNVVFPAVGITALLLLITFAMHDSHHTHRWIRFGLLSFQPSEIAKPVLVLFLAWFLQNRVGRLDDWRRSLLPAALPSLLFIALILKEPDLGTAMVCAAVTALMLYLAGAKIRYLFYALLAASPVLYYMLFHVAWRRARLVAFL
ncbi:MAG TPA: FtsW/RodA/SpoVE family cell cycle protein, partial [Acidobacteriaceae bacterium]|nr:FtsW/RodA/SpoVE family cell cycle protein [Acidobacteriaceae bacterium]